LCGLEDDVLGLKGALERRPRLAPIDISAKVRKLVQERRCSRPA
jgi:hypothetical protein